MTLGANILKPWAAGCCAGENPNAIVAAQEKIAVQNNSCQTPWWFYMALAGAGLIVLSKRG